jgi:hypothetical protein
VARWELLSSKEPVVPEFSKHIASKESAMLLVKCSRLTKLVGIKT